MAFMRPIADHFAAYHVETNEGTIVVPVDVCGDLDHAGATFNGTIVIVRETDANVAQLADYIPSGKVYGIERREGWYARLSAPGYLDCTEWDGPHGSEESAIASVCETYDCDENGDDDAGDISTRKPRKAIKASRARARSGASLPARGATTEHDTSERVDHETQRG